MKYNGTILFGEMVGFFLVKASFFKVIVVCVVHKSSENVEFKLSTVRVMFFRLQDFGVHVSICLPDVT